MGRAGKKPAKGPAGSSKPETQAAGAPGPGAAADGASPEPAAPKEQVAAKHDVPLGNGSLKSKDVRTNGGKEREPKVASAKDKEKKDELSIDPNQTVVEASCKQALVSLRRGNPAKAVKIISEVTKKCKENALGHRICGHIHFKLWNTVEEKKKKEQHMKSALEAARLAATLSPRSIEYRLFYANVMLENAEKEEEYMEVQRECERALGVEDPRDPADDHLGELESDQAQLSPESRIEGARSELRNLSQRAQMAHMQSWVQELAKSSSGQEKMRFIQLRGKVPEENLEQRVGQSKRADQVKKNVKTKDQLREEIEVRVAAARLLQQQQEKSRMAEANGTGATGAADGEVRKVDGEADGERSGGAGGAPKRDTKERLKNKMEKKEGVKRLKGMAAVDKIERVKEFWLSISEEKRNEFLSVKVDELKQQVGGHKEKENIAMLNEAFDFGQSTRHWIFWECCRCKKRFYTRDDFSGHVMDEHIGQLPKKLQNLLPNEPADEWADMLMEEKQQPIMGPLAARLLVEEAQREEARAAELAAAEAQEKQQAADAALAPSSPPALEAPAPAVSVTLGSGSARGGADSGSDGSRVSRSSSFEQFEDPVFEGEGEEASPTSPKQMDIEECRAVEPLLKEGEHHPNCQGDCQHKGLAGPSFPEKHQLPLANDPERAKLLDKIAGLFKALYHARCLTSSHVEKVIQFTQQQVANMLPDHLQRCEVPASPLLVRFLRAEDLKNVQRYLVELVSALRIPMQEQPLGDNTITLEVLSCLEVLPSDQLLFTNDFQELQLDPLVVHEEPPQPQMQPMQVDGGEGALVEGASELALALAAEEEKALASAHQLVDPIDQPLIVNLRRGAKEEGRPFGEVQLQWLYTSADNEARPTEFRKHLEDRMREAREYLSDMEKNWAEIKRLTERKRELMMLEDALTTAERQCQEEVKRRQSGERGAVGRDFEKVLAARLAELEQDVRGGQSQQRRVECQALADVMRESRSLQMPRLFEPLRWRSEEGDGDGKLLQLREFVDQGIETAIGRLREQYMHEINQMDGRIIQAVNEYRCAEIRQTNASIFDYRGVILPLVKGMLQHRLEEASEADAVKRTDAAGAALLKEIERVEAAGKTEKANKGPEATNSKAPKGKEKKKAKKVKGKVLGSTPRDGEADRDGAGDDDDDDEGSFGAEWGSGRGGGGGRAAEEDLALSEEALRRQQEAEEAEAAKLADMLARQKMLEEEARRKQWEKKMREAAERAAQAPSPAPTPLSNGWGSSHDDTPSHSLTNGTFPSDSPASPETSPPLRQPKGPSIPLPIPTTAPPGPGTGVGAPGAPGLTGPSPPNKVGASGGAQPAARGGAGAGGVVGLLPHPRRGGQPGPAPYLRSKEPLHGGAPVVPMTRALTPPAMGPRVGGNRPAQRDGVPAGAGGAGGKGPAPHQLAPAGPQGVEPGHHRGEDVSGGAGGEVGGQAKEGVEGVPARAQQAKNGMGAGGPVGGVRYEGQQAGQMGLGMGMEEYYGSGGGGEVDMDGGHEMYLMEGGRATADGHILPAHVDLPSGHHYPPHLSDNYEPSEPVMHPGSEPSPTHPSNGVGGGGGGGGAANGGHRGGGERGQVGGPPPEWGLAAAAAKAGQQRLSWAAMVSKPKLGGAGGEGGGEGGGSGGRVGDGRGHRRA